MGFLSKRKVCKNAIDAKLVFQEFLNVFDKLVNDAKI